MPSVVNRSLATFGMYLALYVLCGFYIYHRQPELLANLGPFCTLLAMVLLTVGACKVTDHYHWDAELVPLLLLGMALLGFTGYVLMAGAIGASLEFVKQIQENAAIYTGVLFLVVVVIVIIGIAMDKQRKKREALALLNK